jgi:RimJ/RimL family protein N-acetyltransferase
MVEELEWIALATAVPRLRLWVLDTNPTAWDAYLKLGFSPEPDHVKATTKSDGGRPVLERRMVKDLLGPRTPRPVGNYSPNGAPLT